MRSIFLMLLCLLTLSSCSLDDDAPQYRLELLPIESVELPSEFQIGNTYSITLRYIKPTTCHIYDGIYFEKDLNIRTFAVRSAVLLGGNCLSTDNEVVEQTFDFYVTSNGSYIFKFWHGTDENGEEIYLEYEIPVTD
jgi:hypothetical protein